VFFRDIASITMDLDDVESIDFRAFGGADTVTVHDVSGTDLTAATTSSTAAPVTTSKSRASAPTR
jgi:hypothetical protein